jgi:flagella basal body P-ring formation protein FlgA
MIRILAFVPIFLGIAGAALAGPVLKSEVTVTGAIVTVGDMFEDAGELAAAPLFRAPLPGTAGIVSLDAVRQAASAAGIAEFDAEGVIRVRVARDATAIDEATLIALINADLTKRGIASTGVTAVTTLDEPGMVINAEATDRPAALISLRYMPGSGAFAARFVIAGHDKPVDVTGRIDLMIEAPHLVSTMRAGSVLRDTDIEMKLVPLKYAETSGFARRDELIGKALLRQSRAGMMLRSSDVGEPELVSRNDIVTVYFRSGAMTLTVKGQALDGAAKGEPLAVLNLMSRKILTAVAIGDGAVEVFSSPMTVAGL